MIGRSWAVPAAVVGAGMVIIVVLGAVFSLSGHDTGVLVGWSAGGAAAVTVLAAGVLRAARGTRTGTQIVIVAMAPVVAVGLGITFAARAMFIADHDLRSLLVVLVGAGTVGLAAAVVLGRRITTASRSVATLARDIGVADQSPVPPLRGAPGELAALARQLEQTSERLAAARSQTAALERGRRELVAWVSHDLRTPLSGMRAMVEAMQDGVVSDDETVGRYHRTLLAEIERLSVLVDDLFVLATIEAGAIQLRVEPVSFDELVSDALAGVSAKASTRGVDLGATMDGPLVVELSAAEMSRVVHNLLDNAIRHTPAGRSVRVETGSTPDGERVHLAVLDGCGGIAEADIERVFDVAYRGDAARSADTGGGGLGLAVARGLVEAHDGGLTVDNVGDGCRFVIDLPVRRAVGDDRR